MWGAHYGAICRGISWTRFTLPQLLEIVACVGGVGLSVIFRLMAEDHAGSSGVRAAAACTLLAGAGGREGREGARHGRRAELGF